MRWVERGGKGYRERLLREQNGINTTTRGGRERLAIPEEIRGVRTSHQKVA